MKKLILSILLTYCFILPAKAVDIDIEFLVDKRIESMEVPYYAQACVKEVTMKELRRRGAIQTYILDLIVRKIIVEAYDYCKNR